ncbi:TPA: hypothetical protein ACH3X2_005099 [Trebouxia sp. C0005]
MALVSKHCRIATPISSTVTVTPRACTRSSKLLCRAALQQAPKHTTRRESLGFLLALPLLVSTQTAQAVDLGDFRRAKDALDSLDQARSDTEDYKNRFSMQGGQSNLSLEEHKSRAKESFARLQSDVKKAVDAKAYPRVSADIRHQLGTLSFDLKKVAQAQGDKASRKQFQQLQKAAMDSLAELDFSARKKNDSKLQEAYALAVQAVGDVVAKLA